MTRMMITREQKRKAWQRDKEVEVEDLGAKKKRAQQELARKVEEELDELLDEIDGILEDNAEEFVNSYVQKGGE